MRQEGAGAGSLQALPGSNPWAEQPLPLTPAARTHSQHPLWRRTAGAMSTHFRIIGTTYPAHSRIHERLLQFLVVADILVLVLHVEINLAHVDAARVQAVHELAGHRAAAGLRQAGGRGRRGASGGGGMETG